MIVDPRDYLIRLVYPPRRNCSSSQFVLRYEDYETFADPLLWPLGQRIDLSRERHPKAVGSGSFAINSVLRILL